MDEFTQMYRAEGNVMHVQLTGKFPNERLREEQNLWQPLIEACAKCKCRGAVIDARVLEVDFDTMALFRAGVDASDLIKAGLRVALVARKDMISPFFDDVIHNRAAPVQVFTDLDGASSWINTSRYACVAG